MMFRNRRLACLLILVFLMALILAACGGDTAAPTNTPVETDASVTLPPEPTSTETPLPPTEVPTDTPEPSADLWDQIEARGSLIVGTSADYPPFEYIDSDTFQLDGFDVALIREIGRRLGLKVEIRDMGFDGLGDSLQLYEIDVAIAALSATVDRLVYVDFTNVYYVGADAILAKAGMGRMVTTVEDMAGARVGVQRGSVYETWIQDTLVNNGLLPQENLITYQTTVNALSALSSTTPEIDYLVMDQRPAEEAAQGGAVEIVALGLNQQLYSIAIPKGETTLQQRLNAVLLEMQTDGTITSLARKYLALIPDQILPTPTAWPTPVITPLPPGICLDGMEYVADLNYEDQNMTNPPILGPGDKFTKGWRLKNTGTCTWNETYALVPVGGADLGGQATYVQGLVQPGQEYDMYVDLVAPTSAGTYQSFWSMRNNDGEIFGTKVWAGIRVVGQGETEPPPQPVITNFEADPDNLSLGACTTLSWTFEGRALTKVQIKRDGNVIFESDPISPGSLQDCPDYVGEIEYRLIVWAEADVKTNKNIYVDVTE
jgi:polar amino acid transport system substrate-binding protein